MNEFMNGTLNGKLIKSQLLSCIPTDGEIAGPVIDQQKLLLLAVRPDALGWSPWGYGNHSGPEHSHPHTRPFPSPLSQRSSVEALPS